MKRILKAKDVDWFGLHVNRQYIVNLSYTSPEYLYDFDTAHPYYGVVSVYKYHINNTNKDNPRTFVGYFDARDSDSPLTLHNSLGPSYEDSDRVGFSLQGEKMTIESWSDKIKYLQPAADDQEIMKYLMMYDG